MKTRCRSYRGGDFKTAKYQLCHMVINYADFMQLYNGEKNVGQKEIENIQFEEENSTRICNGTAKVYAERDKEIKKRSDLRV
ncbi:hypothetical protein STEG23_037042 [Scotinomys teguina]